MSVDIGGRSDGADWSVISVIDRYFLMEGGVEECIGTWRGHLDQDLVIWKAVQIAKFFNSALLVPESNSLDMKGDEGDHSLTILDVWKKRLNCPFENGGRCPPKVEARKEQKVVVREWSLKRFDFARVQHCFFRSFIPILCESPT